MRLADAFLTLFISCGVVCGCGRGSDTGGGCGQAASQCFDGNSAGSFATQALAATALDACEQEDDNDDGGPVIAATEEGFAVVSFGRRLFKVGIVGNALTSLLQLALPGGVKNARYDSDQLRRCVVTDGGRPVVRLGETGLTKEGKHDVAWWVRRNEAGDLAVHVDDERAVLVRLP